MIKMTLEYTNKDNLNIKDSRVEIVINGQKKFFNVLEISSYEESYSDYFYGRRRTGIVNKTLALLEVPEMSKEELKAEESVKAAKEALKAAEESLRVIKEKY